MPGRRSTPSGRVLTARELNRTLLGRQFLVDRADLPVTTAVERLVGLNAQDPNPPYLAPWSRLDPFVRSDLTAAIEDGSVVRSTVLRATQHLVTSADLGRLRPVVAPLLRRVQRTTIGRRTAAVDVDAVVAGTRTLLADGRVLSRPELGRVLTGRHTGADPSALGWTVRCHLPIVHPAPSGTWNVHGPTTFALAECADPTSEVGSDAGTDTVGMADAVAELVPRYLTVFGPAAVPDARTWSGVGGLREVFEMLRPRLRTYRSESGRELFDVPQADLEDGDRAAPARFLPPFDAAVLAHADRTRIMTDDVRRAVCDGAAVAPTVLVDGTAAAVWDLSAWSAPTRLAVRPLRAPTAAERAEVEAEGSRLLAFVTDVGGREAGEVRVLGARDPRALAVGTAPAGRRSPARRATRRRRGGPATRPLLRPRGRRAPPGAPASPRPARRPRRRGRPRTRGRRAARAPTPRR